MSERAIPMMPVPSETFWSRLRTTPLRDALRGRLTGSLDARRTIAAANLPEPLSGLIYETIRHARLSRAKRLEAARELINGFRGNLSSGRQPNELVASFGDPAGAAQLIRRELRLAALALSSLPQSLAEIVYAVVLRTRLWKSERVDVARELIEHFRDGIDTGRTPEELVESFGNLRQAARLIRRAKLRNRPLAWQIWRRAVQATSLLALVIVCTYGFFWLRYLTAKPTISHNYELELTAAARAVPQADRAWPPYREAALRMTPEPHDEGWSYSAAIEKPGGKHWDSVLSWLSENRAALETIRKAADRPHLGFVYGDAADRPWLEKIKVDPVEMDIKRNSPMSLTLLPQLQELGNISHLILADAHRAAAENDTASFVRDVEALVGLASQARDGQYPFLVSDAISFSFLEHTIAAVDEVIAENPKRLSDDDLRRLAHCIAGYEGGGTLRCRLFGGRLIMKDIYQRVYTDDGHGDGRLTPEGLQFLDRLKMLPDDGIVWALTPVFCGLSSRRELNRLTEEFFDRLDREINRPLWELSDSPLRDDVEKWSRSPIDKIRYAPLVRLSPLIDSAFMGERITQLRDATLVALALELYHRRHGEWPKALDELVPDMIPTVPPDRFTGSPLLYRVVNDRPVLYSAGPDKKDDGGRSVADPAAVHFFPANSTNGVPNGAVPQGDLILWPPQPANSSP